MGHAAVQNDDQRLIKLLPQTFYWRASEASVTLSRVY